MVLTSYTGNTSLPVREALLSTGSDDFSLEIDGIVVRVGSEIEEPEYDESGTVSRIRVSEGLNEKTREE